MRALATQLFRHKRVRTTEAKAKEARRFAEAIITRAKRAHLAEQSGTADIHARRVVARDINDSAVVRELFGEIAPKVASRNGGYTRVVKLGTRLGDGARMAILELVDYNMERDENAARIRTRKSISRAERVARSRARQAETGAPATASADRPADTVQPAATAPVTATDTAEATVNESASAPFEGTAGPNSDAPTDEDAAEEPPEQA